MRIKIFKWNTLCIYIVCAFLSGNVSGQTLPDDHSDTATDATPIRLDVPISGQLHRDDIDVFRIEIASTVDVSIFTDSTIDTTGRLYDGSLTFLTFDDDSGNDDNFLIRGRLYPDTYYIRVRGFRGFLVGAYTLTVQTDTITDIHSDTTADATPISLDAPINGELHSGDVDFFRINVASRTDVSIFTEGTVNTRGRLYDGSLTPLVFDDDSGTFRNFRILERLDPETTYYIAVRGFSAFSVGAYTLTIQMENYIPFVCPPSKFADPLYGCQWHLKNAGRNGATAGEDINIESVWDTYKGNGIHIAVVDRGMHFAHEDLKDNVDTALNYDYTPETPSIYVHDNNHGTAVSGLIAARDNDLGVRGVAPRATIYGYNLRDNDTDINEADAMTRNRVETVVSNNSWGPRDDVALRGPGRIWEMAIETGVSEGSGGKGIVYVFAAGNGARTDDNSNYNGYANYYAVTAVCAVNDRGIRSSYSEQGANLWVCAPSSDGDRGRQGIVTTDNAHRYIDDFGGTSAATPIVSGVVALVRQANPELSWRDVKLVLAASARRNDPDNSGWEDGAVQYDAASERYTFNHEYGFGVVDAQAAVDLAQDWKNVPSMKTAESAIIPVNQNIPDNLPTGITRSLQIASDIDFIEFVEINVDFNHPHFIDLDMRLTSPSGAVSELIVHEGERRLNLDFFAVATSSWRFGSARHLGEDPSGIWKLEVADRLASNEGRLESWSLKIYGHSNNQEASGEPSITGIPQVGAVLTAMIGGITDGNGLNTANYAWQWQVSTDRITWTDIPGANTAEFIPALIHQDQFLRVVASFTDDDGFRESRASTSVGPVLGPPSVLVTAAVTLTEINLDGSMLVMTITDAVWNDPLAVADFSLAGAPAGVSIMGVERNTDTTATLTLAFDGTDFDTNHSLRVQVLKSAVSRYTGEPILSLNSAIVIANRDPVVSGLIAVPQAAVGSEYRFMLPDDVFIDPDNDVLIYELMGLPPALVFSTADRTISGIPMSTGNFTITWLALDPGGESATVQFDLTVKPAGFPLVVNPINSLEGLLDEEFRFSLIDHQVFMDSVPAGGTLTYTIMEDPLSLQWLIFSADEGLFNGTPSLEDDLEPFMVTVIATDTDGNQNSHILEFSVRTNIKLRLKVFLEGAQ